jgi:hypothetical protein
VIHGTATNRRLVCAPPRGGGETWGRQKSRNIRQSELSAARRTEPTRITARCGVGGLRGLLEMAVPLGRAENGAVAPGVGIAEVHAGLHIGNPWPQ